ncbi:MAG: BlaI/MecI/CopY family transcriptional regulator [Armatimonadota bacterium]
MINPFRHSRHDESGSPGTHRLSRRERQIMEILFREGRASAAEVQAALPDPPGYSAVRALLRILEEKGHLTHVREGQRYVFLPTLAQQSAARSALQQVVQTFFSGSVERAVTTLLSEADPLSDDELERLSGLIAQAKQDAAAESAERKDTEEAE